MAEHSSFFDSVSGDRVYSATDFANYFSSLLSDGVMPSPSTNLQVLSNNNMTITVKVGKGWIGGHTYWNDADLIMNLAIADGTLNRIDRLVLQLSTTGRAINLAIKQGTTGSTPVAPVLQRDADFYELGIADIYVTKGTTTIAQAKITDLRINPTYCGWVNSLISVDGTTLYAQLTDTFNTWFNGLQTQLGGDVAGNLQTEITNLDTATYKKSDWTSGNGWDKYPNGVLRQKGVTTIKNNHILITFPIQFSTATGIVVTLTVQNATSSNGYTVWSGLPVVNAVNIYANTTANVICYWTAEGR